jgi:hypothetical protein
MQQLQERIKRMRDQGGDPSPMIDAVRESKRLIDEGKLPEAEAALDKVLALDAPEKK